jgi:anti-anti-sigma factor
MMCQVNGSGRADTGGVSTVSVRHLPGAIVLTVDGEIDMTTAPGFEDAVRRSPAEQPATLVIDLGDASFFSSAGIAVLMFAHGNRDGVAVRVVATDRIVLRPLELTGLTADLAIYPDLSSALAQ